MFDAIMSLLVTFISAIFYVILILKLDNIRYLRTFDNFNDLSNISIHSDWFSMERK